MTLGIPHDQAARSEASRILALATHQSEELFLGAGATREALRRHDWSASPLGPHADWPPALSSSVLHILWSAFPNLVLWGVDLLVLFNDAYIDLVGADTVTTLGLPARDGMPCIWEIVSPILSRVRDGETLSCDDAELTITRKGAPMTVRRTLSFAPMHDEAGVVHGVLVTVFDSDHVSPHRAD